jgi:hypothetical protein
MNRWAMSDVRFADETRVTFVQSNAARFCKVDLSTRLTAAAALAYSELQHRLLTTPPPKKLTGRKSDYIVC